MITRFFGMILKTEFGVPAEAQISSYCRRSSSMRGVIFVEWANGGTPPITKPVWVRTKPASAFSRASFNNSSIFFSSTRLLPLVITKMGFPVDLDLKIIDLAIWEIVQPIASAAS